MGDTFEALLARARVLTEIGRHRDAIPLLLKARALRPNDVQSACLLAVALLEIGRPTQALSAVESVLGGSEWPFRIRSLCLIRLRRPDAAIASAEEAVKHAPNEPLAHIMLAAALLERGRDSEALAAVDQAVRLSPDSSTAHVLRGRALIGMRLRGKAQAEFLLATKLDPTEWQARNALGVALLRRWRLTAAQRHFLGALRMDPRQSVPLENLGAVLSRRLSLMLVLAELSLLLSPPIDFGHYGKPYFVIPLIIIVPLGLYQWKEWRALPRDVRTRVPSRWSTIGSVAASLGILAAIGMVLHLPPSKAGFISVAQDRAVELRECLPAGYRAPKTFIHCHLRLAPSGKVVSAGIDRELAPRVQGCMRDRMVKWHFGPTHRGAALDIHFRFRAGTSGEK